MRKQCGRESNILPNQAGFLVSVPICTGQVGARGLAFAGAVEHGDLHFRNILLSDETVSFIDFSNHNEFYSQRDIANLWLANCPDHLAGAGRSAGFGMVAQADWAAFQEGYGADLTSDPIFQFFYAMRLLHYWQRIATRTPSDERKMLEQSQAVNRVFTRLLVDEERVSE